MASVRKKLLLFPPMAVFPSGSVAVATGGITNASFAANAIGPTTIAADARGQVKSIQRGVIELGASATTATATLSPAVDPSKTELRFLGHTTGSSSTGFAELPFIALTNGTTVTATRAGTGGGTVTAWASWEITERY